MANYQSMMRDLDRRIEDRERNSETALRELFLTRRKVWDMYPRVGALEDQSYQRDSNSAKYQMLAEIDKKKGSTLRSYGSVGDLTRDIPSTRSRRASYDYSSYSRPLGGRSYGTTSAADKYETTSLSGYRPGGGGDDDDDDVATSGYKSYKSSADKWETQSLADYPIKTRYSTSSYSRPSRSKYGYGTDDYGTSSGRNYKGYDDSNLEAMTRWKTSNSASRRNYYEKKKYDDWSSPRYSPRSPLNPYLQEANLTTSYQSPRTLVRPEYVDDDEEVENLSLSRYNKVSLTDRYRPESSKNYYLVDDSPYHRKAPNDTTGDYSYSRYKSSDIEPTDIPSYKPRSQYSTQKYTSESNDYDSPTRGRSRYSYTSGYSSPTRRYGDVSADNSPSRYSSHSKYDGGDDDDRLSDISSASQYARKTPRVDTYQQRYYPSAPGSYVSKKKKVPTATLR